MADVLFGKVNPSAKLSITLPTKENEVGFKPAEYPGINLQGDYNEKQLIGYRWYTAHKVVPAFAFGHGLSYTSFNYANVSCSNEKVSAVVTNSGKRAGAEVAQLYLEFPAAANTPPLQLKGFVKTRVLQPNESVKINFHIRDRDLSVWDITTHGWMKISGTYKVKVGAASDDIRLTGEFVV